MNVRAQITFVFLVLASNAHSMSRQDEIFPKRWHQDMPQVPQSCAEKFIHEYGYCNRNRDSENPFCGAEIEERYRHCFANKLTEKERQEAFEGSLYSRETIERRLRVNSSGQATSEYSMPKVFVINNGEGLEGELSCTHSTNLLDDLRKFDSRNPSANSSEVGSCYVKELKEVPCSPPAAYRSAPEELPACHTYEFREVPIHPSIAPAIPALYAAQEKLRKESPAVRANRLVGPYFEPLNIGARLSGYLLRRRAEQESSQGSPQN